MLKGLLEAALISGCLAFSASGPATAQENTAADAVRAFKSKNAGALLYIEGVADGLRTSNALAQVLQRDRLFCVPPGQTLSDVKMIDILSDYLNWNPKTRADPFVSTLVFAIFKEYPCRR